ncbi:TDP-N-acetylfucosamine:lipid II N-acetylfucosaminyltransferase [Shewanella waksmanii]|uniref:TDP-N-acetylfucosamine:lipid II N-acetylfucosaminyltransferase n=1 Tax=Shewanella waksmanii TaxID=213783 RepID=UPI00373520C5
MIIHIFENIPHHYHNFMGFFRAYCNVKNNHKVFIESSKNETSDRENAERLAASGFNAEFYCNSMQLVKLMQQENAKSEFIFHSLHNRTLCLHLNFTKLLKRCSWVSWGADTYQYLGKSRTFREVIAKSAHVLACRRMHFVKSLNPGDGKLIQHTFGRKKVETLPYPLVEVSPPETLPIQTDGPLSIMLGNSAAKSNNHPELLASVAHLSNENIELIMPLNYAGTDEYIETVIDQGKAIFGHKFIPIQSMLSKAEYDKLLARIDVTVFAHDRQQGLYVAYYMMLHGKQLFLKSSTSTYENFKSYHFTIGSIDDLSQQSVEQLRQVSPKTQLKNQQILLENFTEAALAPKWSNFFDKLTQSHL